MVEAANRHKDIGCTGDIEGAVVATLIQSPECYVKYKKGGLSSTDFEYQTYRFVFDVLSERMERSHAAAMTPALLADSCKQRPCRDVDVDDAIATIDQLCRMVVVPDDFPEMARRLRERARCRKARDIAVRLQERVATDGSSAIADAVRCLAQLEDVDPESTVDYIGLLNSGWTYLQELTDPHARPGVIYLGLKDLDNITGGAHPGDLFVIAGRVSMCKTALLVSALEAGVWSEQIRLEYRNHALKQSVEPNTVAVFSPDQSRRQVGLRKLIQLGGIDSHAARSGNPGGDDVRAAGLSIRRANEDPLPLYFNDKPDITIEEIVSQATHLAYTSNLKAIYVDYLQKIQSRAGFKPTDTNSRVAYVTAELRRLARNLGIAVIGLSQFSREVERSLRGIPTLSHLANSGEIEREATCVVAIHREEVYEADAEPGRVDMYVLKNSNGPVGRAAAYFDESHIQIINPPSDGVAHRPPHAKAEDDDEQAQVALIEGGQSL